jgi:hypothetical protein
MSHEAKVAVIKASSQPGRFSDAEFRVLMLLADHLNGATGRCDPSLKVLGDEAGKDRGYLRRILGALEARGEIARADSSSKGGKGHRQQYILLLKGDSQSPFAGSQRVTDSTAKGDSQHHQRVTGRSSDLRKRGQPGSEPGKNQRERAGSTPHGAGRARSNPPPPSPCTHPLGEPCRNLCDHGNCATECGTCHDPRREVTA